MTGKELIATVAYRNNLQLKSVELVINEMRKIIQQELKKGEKVTLTGFGTFEVKQRAARKGTNPRTGETIKLPATKLPIFRAGAALKKAVRK